MRPANDVDAVVMGNVVQAGVGPNPVRQAAIGAGLPYGTPVTTLNKLCLSGLSAIAYADRLIRLGQYDTEAFAGVALTSSTEPDIDEERLNVNGGAIAIGQPLGMSGARLVLTLAQELRRRGGGAGVAALCGGGGQGAALVVRAR